MKTSKTVMSRRASRVPAGYQLVANADLIKLTETLAAFVAGEIWGVSPGTDDPRHVAELWNAQRPAFVEETRRTAQQLAAMRLGSGEDHAEARFAAVDDDAQTVERLLPAYDRAKAAAANVGGAK